MTLEQELTELNINIGEAEKRRDQVTLDRILADDLIFRRASGAVVDKATYLEDLVKPENTYIYLCSEVVDVKLSESQDTAIVTLHVRAKGKRGDQPFEGIYRNVRDFRKEGQDWKCYAWFNEPLETPPENLRAAYQTLCTSYNAIDGIRGQLLGFLPLASAGLFTFLEKKPADGESTLQIGWLGFVITLGLYIFEIYGTRRCTHLIVLGQHLEAQMKTEGQFTNRPKGLEANPKPKQFNFLALINEPLAAGVIYPAVASAWLYLARHGSPDAFWVALKACLIGFILSCVFNFWLTYHDAPKKANYYKSQ